MDHSQTLQALVKADDLKKKWPKEKLISAFVFPARVHNVMLHFRWKDQDEICLEELLEFIISSDKDPRPGYIVSRFLGYRNVGKKGFWEAIDRLNAVDFGEKGNALWQSKYRELKSSYRVYGLGHLSSILASKKGVGYKMQLKQKDLSPPEGFNLELSE